MQKKEMYPPYRFAGKEGTFQFRYFLFMAHTPERSHKARHQQRLAIQACC